MAAVKGRFNLKVGDTIGDLTITYIDEDGVPFVDLFCSKCGTQLTLADALKYEMYCEFCTFH